MKKEELFEIIGELDDDIVKGAKIYMETKKKNYFVVFGAVAACLCLMICGTFMLNGNSSKPNPDMVQVVTPFIEVASIEEMEQYLDFKVPTLEKEVDSYLVFVEEKYPYMARIIYQDDSTFTMKYGSGDVSGIYGGKFEKEETVDGVSITYYIYDTIRYALWESDGFTYSLTGSNNLEEEVAKIIK